MAEKPENQELEQIAEIFQRYGVAYIVIGGQAEVLHGSPRVTYDVDLCYLHTKENIQRMADALAELKPTLRGAPAGLPFRADAKTLEAGSNFTFDTTIIPLDLLGHVEPLGDYAEVRKNAVRYMSGDLELWTISLDDLLRVKLHINRVKDQESIAQLKAIKRVREEGARG